MTISGFQSYDGNPHGFFLSQDSSSHWYVVPRAKEKEWSEWVNLDDDNEDAWETPIWAFAIGGAPSRVTFSTDGFMLK